jgi:hypothetical protein
MTWMNKKCSRCKKEKDIWNFSITWTEKNRKRYWAVKAACNSCICQFEVKPWIRRNLQHSRFLIRRSVRKTRDGRYRAVGSCGILSRNGRMCQRRRPHEGEHFVGWRGGSERWMKRRKYRKV